MTPEDRLQAACVDYLSRSLKPGWKAHHVPNGFHVHGAGRLAAIREMQKLKKLGLLPGVADLTITGPREHPSGGLLYAEVKIGKNGLSPAQREWRDHALATGRPFTVIRSVDAIEDFLDANGVPLRARLRPIKRKDAA